MGSNFKPKKYNLPILAFSNSQDVLEILVNCGMLWINNWFCVMWWYGLRKFQGDNFSHLLSLVIFI